MQHLHYFSSLHSRKTICTPTAHCCSHKPHFQCGTLPAGSNPACYYPSPSRIQSKPAATRSPDYYILRLPSLRQEVCSSGANIILFPSQFESGEESKDGQWVHSTQSCQNQGMHEGGFILSTRSTTSHFVADGQRSAEARGTEWKPKRARWPA